MSAVDRIENELPELSDEGLADIVVAVLAEVGSRGRNAGEAAVVAVRNAVEAPNANVDIEEGIAQLEPIFES